MSSKYIKKRNIPDGFREILSDFTKEILRNQPLDIIDFGCEYFRCLQEGDRLDYEHKGDNLPCDFDSRPLVPKKSQPNKRKFELNNELKKIHTDAAKKIDPNYEGPELTNENEEGNKQNEEEYQDYMQNNQKESAVPKEQNPPENEEKAEQPADEEKQLTEKQKELINMDVSKPDSKTFEDIISTIKQYDEIHKETENLDQNQGNEAADEQAAGEQAAGEEVKVNENTNEAAEEQAAGEQAAGEEVKVNENTNEEGNVVIDTGIYSNPILIQKGQKQEENTQQEDCKEEEIAVTKEVQNQEGGDGSNTVKVEQTIVKNEEKVGEDGSVVTVKESVTTKIVTTTVIETKTVIQEGNN